MSNGRKTLVEEGTQFKGSMSSDCPIEVKGRIEGDLAAPSLQVSPSGAVHGKFLEKESPGITGATQLVVTAGGSLIGAVEQPADLTRFAFEPGCMLRMKIQPKKERPETTGQGGRNR